MSAVPEWALLYQGAEDYARACRQALELRNSLEEMLNAALEERLPSEEVRGRAFEVFLKAKGLA